MKRVTSVTSKNEEYEIVDAVAREEKLNVSDLPKNLSYFDNDLELIDKTVDDLLNYYKKSETYSRDEVRELLTARLTIKKVSELPTEDISSATIYFVPKHNESDERDYYDEYIWVDNQWELIGNTYVDLTDYYTKPETDRIVQSKVDSEMTAREISESQIRGSIQTLAESINSNTESINSEIDSRIASEMEFRGGISNLSENLSDEINRATNAENTLSNRCNGYDTHIYNVKNPHNVTKSQIGLDNVKNVSTDDEIIENSSNNVSGGAVYNALQNKVDKVSGKGLSDQNFTFAEKMKLAGLSNYNDTELNSRVTATESAITTLNGDSSVSGSVDKKIADAMSGITGFDFVIVSALPASGEKGIIYLTPQPTQGEQDSYDEYIWLDSAWEYLGKKSVTVDLTDYYTKAQVNALVSVKQDKITVADDSSTLTDDDSFDESPAGTNGTTVKRRSLPSLWTYIRRKFETYFSIFFHNDDLRIFNDNGDIEIGEPNDENAHVTHILNDCNMEHELTVNGDVGVGGSIGIEGDMSVLGEIDQIGTLADLTTTAKTDLVSAINEVYNMDKELVVGASTIRKGTFTFIPRANSQFCDATITFTTPMPDADYEVTISWVTETGISMYGRVQKKTANGFKFEGYYGSATDANMYGNQEVAYTAFKLFTKEGLEDLENDVSALKTKTQYADVVQSGNMKAVTSNAVYDALANSKEVPPLNYYIIPVSTSIPGITITKRDNNPKSLYAVRNGNSIILNFSLALTGTFTGTESWYDLFNWSDMLSHMLKDGETVSDFGVPYFCTGMIDNSANILDGVMQGRSIYMYPGTFNNGIQGQIMLTVSKA